MDLSSHRKWVSDYMSRNYGVAGSGMASDISVDNKLNLIIDNFDCRVSLLKDQIPFMEKDRFCVRCVTGSDRDGRYVHYRFVFPLSAVESGMNAIKAHGRNSRIEDEKGSIRETLRSLEHQMDRGNYMQCMSLLSSVAIGLAQCEAASQLESAGGSDDDR